MDTTAPARRVVLAASGFFSRWHPVGDSFLGLLDDDASFRRDCIEYVNIPRALGTLISAGMATLHELDTVYGIEDVYMMLEVLSVDNHNRRMIARARDRRDAHSY